MPKPLPLALIVVATLAGIVGPLRALEPKWPPGPYKYLVIDQDLKDVLTEFGRNVGMPVDVSDQVKGKLHGQLPDGTANAFLDKLCASYGLVWYYDGAMLHINAKTEVKTALIDIGRLPSDQLTTRLNALGIADPRFPVRSTPDAGVVSVSGPPSYIALVRQTLATMRVVSVREEVNRITIWRGVKPQAYDLPQERPVPGLAARTQDDTGTGDASRSPAQAANTRQDALSKPQDAVPEPADDGATRGSARKQEPAKRLYAARRHKRRGKERRLARRR